MIYPIRYDLIIAVERASSASDGSILYISICTYIIAGTQAR
jgi:hypothetical protein